VRKRGLSVQAEREREGRACKLREEEKERDKHACEARNREASEQAKKEESRAVMQVERERQGKYAN
jgi:hypothetical protein